MQPRITQTREYPGAEGGGEASKPRRRQGAQGKRGRPGGSGPYAEGAQQHSGECSIKGWEATVCMRLRPQEYARGIGPNNKGRFTCPRVEALPPQVVVWLAREGRTQAQDEAAGIDRSEYARSVWCAVLKPGVGCVKMKLTQSPSDRA